uniref:Uncharacterized protein n=1 Tax=Anopheles maculatus TaxID=74869 RepID=A0A182T4L8_9DIPT
MAQTITEWSTSSSNTLIAQVEALKQLESGAGVGSAKGTSSGERSSATPTRTFEYVPLKPPKVVKKVAVTSPDDHGRKDFPGVHVKPQIIKHIPIETGGSSKAANEPNVIPDRPTRLPPKIVDVIEKSPKRMPVTQQPLPQGKIPMSATRVEPQDGASKRKSLEMMSKRYQSQDISDTETFTEKLYGQNEKLTERYQSQEFTPITAATSAAPSKPPRGDSLPSSSPTPMAEKPLVKHHSYDDKTLSKSQIREYKTTKMRHSQSFHEHLVSSDLNKIVEESLGSSSTTTHTSEATSTDNSSPMFPRPEKLVRCSPYYSSSLSSESPPIAPNQLPPPVQKPPRKSSLPRNFVPKSPPSGNDTDSSLDHRAQDPKLRSRGYRKKRTVPLKKSRLDRPLEHQESSECSEGYFPEMESGSSDAVMMEHQHQRYPDFEEEL